MQVTTNLLALRHIQYFVILAYHLPCPIAGLAQTIH